MKIQMKTFTVTIHNSTNYGAWLQAFALQNAIESLGHENLIFDYVYETSDTKQSFRSARQLAVMLAYRVISLFRISKIRKRRQAFRHFAQEHLRMSEPYRSMEELRSNPPEAEVYITGSDQVWNFLQREPFMESRFLDFGPASVKRVSYAASVANLNYTDEQKAWVREKLSRFDAISLREKSAQEYISGIIGRRTELVMDPVFLPAQSVWEKLAQSRAINEPYILIYQVQSCPGMDEVIAELKRKTGFKTVAILPTVITWVHTDIRLFDVSPEEFVGLFRGAEIVVSASFHGTAFGLISGKPTYAMSRTKGPSRVKDLMTLCGVPHFCIEDTRELPEPDTFDAGAVESVIEAERERSLGYLRKCLDK